jgi:antitoxin (DNA-binding transcriptional repressor) of toxin-antitoxin stability system
MLKVTVEDAARDLKALLEQVARGEEVVLVEQGDRLIPPQPKEQWLANMKVFRSSLQIKGEPLSATVIKAR